MTSHSATSIKPRSGLGTPTLTRGRPRTSEESGTRPISVSFSSSMSAPPTRQTLVSSLSRDSLLPLPPRTDAGGPIRDHAAEQNHLAIALRLQTAKAGAGFGTDPMRMSVAHTLQPALIKASREAEKLRGEKALLMRHNRYLLLEVSRMHAATSGAVVDDATAAAAAIGIPPAALMGTIAEAHADAPNAAPPDAADAAALPADAATDTVNADAPSQPEMLNWPPHATELVSLRKKYDALKGVTARQDKELSTLRARNRTLEAAERAVAEERRAFDALRAEVMVRAPPNLSSCMLHDSRPCPPPPCPSPIPSPPPFPSLRPLLHSTLSTPMRSRCSQCSRKTPPRIASGTTPPAYARHSRWP